MGAGPVAPWAHWLCFGLVLLSTVAFGHSAPADDQFREGSMGGAFGNPEILAFVGSVSARRSNASSPPRIMQTAGPKREMLKSPFGFRYHTDEELREELIDGRPSPQPVKEDVRQTNIYPSCVGPSDFDRWHPNGRSTFQFFFPQISQLRNRDELFIPQSTTLYLRLKSPAGWRRQKAAVVGAPQTAATPNDVDSENIDSSAGQNLVIINVTEPGCLSFLCRFSTVVDLNRAYPYAKINLKLFGLRWFTTFEREIQRIEITAMDAQTRERLNIGDFFVGMRCGGSESKISLPGQISDEPASVHYLEGLSDSFLSVTYTARSSYSSPSDPAIISSVGINLRDVMRPPSSVRRARLAPAASRFHHHHRGHIRRVGEGHRPFPWPLAGADLSAPTTPMPEQTESRLQCDKRQEFMTFARAGMPSVVEPSGFVFVTCKCTRVCAEGDSSCLPCESRVLSSQTITVKEKIDGELVARERTIPTDCGCY